MEAGSLLHSGAQVMLMRAQARTVASVLAADRAVMDRWLSEIVPTVLTGQRQAVAITDGYLSMEAGIATGTDTAPWGLDPDRLIGRVARRGTPLEDVYARTLLARVAAPSADARLEREVTTDIALARREAEWAHTSRDQRVIGYTRVLGAGGVGGNCDLCIVAATRTYASRDLAPIHAHCGCSVQPVYGAAPAPTIDRRELAEVYDAAGTGTTSTSNVIRLAADRLPAGVEAARLPSRVAVAMSPELGPTLVAA